MAHATGRPLNISALSRSGCLYGASDRIWPASTRNDGKLFERVLLCRLLRIAESDELQAVANPGIDTRSQIHLVYDLRLVTDIWVLTVDITRGFPST